MALKTVPILLGAAHDCSYLPDHVSRLGWVDPALSLDQGVFDQLIEAGFRRSGSGVYRPCCPSCSSCVPVRVPVRRFVPNRAQRRTTRRNEDLAVSLRPPEFDEEHYQLYLRYQRARHADGAMAQATRAEYLEFLAGHGIATWFVEFRLERSLLAIAVVDGLRDGLSAVYTFFDPTCPERGLGTQAVLYLIAEARRRGLSWCYLGYWVNGCRKMMYKRLFRPIEGRIDAHWSTLTDQ